MVVGALEGGVETAGQQVLLDLPVPLVGHELFKPLGETSQLGGREGGNYGFKFFNTHGGRVGKVGMAGKQRLRAISSGHCPGGADVRG